MRNLLILLFSLLVVPFLYGKDYWLVNRSGERVDDRVFNSYHVLNPVYPFLTVVELGHKYALMDSTGTLLTEPVYDGIYAYGDWGLPAERDGAWGILNIRGEEVIPCMYDIMVDYTPVGFQGGYVEVSLNGKWGVLDSLNQVVVPVEYEMVSVQPHIILVFNEKDEVAICDKKGQFISGFDYSEIEYTEIGNVYASPYGYIGRKGGDYVFLSLEGKETFVSKNKTRDLRGLLAVEERRSVSFFDYEGNPLSSMKGEYLSLGWFDEGLIAFGDKKLYGFMDTTGRMVIEPAFQYHDMDELYGGADFLAGGYFSGGMAIVKSGGKWGVIDKTGIAVLPFEYTDINRVSEKSELLAVAGENHLFALFSLEKGFLSDFEYTGISFAPDNEPICCRKGKLKGLLDRNGKEIVACQYDVIRVLDDSVARVELDYKHGLVDLKTGELLTPVLYDMMISTAYPYYSIFCGMERGVIDIYGKEIFPCGNMHVTPVGDGFFVVREGKQQKLIDQSGTTLIPLQDGQIEPWMNNLFWVIK